MIIINIHMPDVDKLVCHAMQQFIDTDLRAFPTICTNAELRRAGERGYEIFITIREANGRERIDPFVEVNISESKTAVVVTAIVTPHELSRNGLGKRLLRKLFEAADREDHALVIAGLVPSFQRRLLARGAFKLNGDNVQIIDKTDLLTPVILVTA